MIYPIPSPAQIADYVKKCSEAFLDFRMPDLLPHLPFELAKPFVKDEVTAEKWQEITSDRPTTREAAVKQLVEYLPFAWDKANNCRGISAGRSIQHFQAWLFLLGEYRVVAELDDYDLYGKPQLRAISERFGVDWRKLDNDRWVYDEGEDGQRADEVPRVTLSWTTATEGFDTPTTPPEQN